MLVSSLGLLALSCNIEISDQEWCIDLGPLGANCFHTQSEQERELTKAQWDKERFGMFCTKSDNLAETIKTQLKLCNRTRACKKEIVKILKRASDKVSEN